MTVLTLRQAAAEIGLHYDTLRKGWAELCAREGFPRPFLRLKWDAAAIEAWKASRSVAPAVEPVSSVQPPDGRRVARARAELQALRAG